MPPENPYAHYLVIPFKQHLSLMKQIIGGILTIGGAVMLVIGIIGLFGSNAGSANPWIYTILGAVFFVAGISLLRSIRTIEGHVDRRL
jgi:hypothetical protein